jgi:hypothetical protein
MATGGEGVAAASAACTLVTPPSVSSKLEIFQVGERERERGDCERERERRENEYGEGVGAKENPLSHNTHTINTAINTASFILLFSLTKPKWKTTTKREMSADVCLFIWIQ